MNLVNILNTAATSEIGTFVFCDACLERLERSQLPSIFRLRKLTNRVEGECIECTEGEATPITFDPVPDTLEVWVTFTDDTDERWSASGQNGHLTYISDGNGHCYTTREALKRRGVVKLYIEAGYELHLDD